jgi:hypothetical protein
LLRVSQNCHPDRSGGTCCSSSPIMASRVNKLFLLSGPPAFADQGRMKRVLAIHSSLTPALSGTLCRKCEVSELSELSPVYGRHFQQTGRSFCLRFLYWRTSRHLSPVLSGVRCLGLVSGGVIFSKLSKLLNQEDALSAPCLRGDCCSPQARPRGAQKCSGQA